MMDCIYLDNNSTTPCAPEVLEAMLPFFRISYANPSSSHMMGRRAMSAVQTAREQVASLIGCDAAELVFTAGATESNNIVLHGLHSDCGGRTAVVTSAIEHKAVLSPCECLEFGGVPVYRMTVDREGQVDLGAAKEVITRKTRLVSVQVANNEVGTIQPIRELAEFAHAQGALFHSDAAQALGKISCNVRELGVDFASFSAHKVYGPKGVGSLYVRGGLGKGVLAPLFEGGGQEGGLRPGTLNVPGIVGMGEACRLAKEKIETGEVDAIMSLRDDFEALLAKTVPGLIVNGPQDHRLPGTSSVTIADVSADILMANVRSVCFSSGSACDSGSVSPSRVLVAMGLTVEQAGNTVRFSIGRYNDRDQIQNAAKLIKNAVYSLRR